ncbi:hypothetical protein [Bradyrhizobium sp. S69]|uniref:hypothetical protein n=1 Tax=Bradyrhizobium sp. S69 TaxID=1641856 RepID=UPI00131B1817|nr:hypothetical protein [Bradyrhizobium sp. S69]
MNKSAHGDALAADHVTSKLASTTQSLLICRSEIVANCSDFKFEAAKLAAGMKPRAAQRWNDGRTQPLTLEGCRRQTGASFKMKESCMPNNDREGRLGGRTLVAIVAVFIVAFAIFALGPGSTTHVASNPGPAGMPESTIINPVPPPASSPSEATPENPR